MTARLNFTRKIKEARALHAGWLCEAVWPETGRCNVQLTNGRVEFHHEVEAERGGDNSFANCRAVCVKCHRKLTRAFVQAKAKAERQRAVQMNSKPASAKPLPFGKDSPRKAKVGGGVVSRESQPRREPLPPRKLYKDII